MRQLEPGERACLKNKREKDREGGGTGFVIQPAFQVNLYWAWRLSLGWCVGFAGQLMGRGTSNRTGPAWNNERGEKRHAFRKRRWMFQFLGLIWALVLTSYKRQGWKQLQCLVLTFKTVLSFFSKGLGICYPFSERLRTLSFCLRNLQSWANSYRRISFLPRINTLLKALSLWVSQHLELLMNQLVKAVLFPLFFWTDEEIVAQRYNRRAAQNIWFPRHALHTQWECYADFWTYKHPHMQNSYRACSPHDYKKPTTCWYFRDPSL